MQISLKHVFLIFNLMEWN